MIAGKNSKAARIKRKGIVHSELSAEVGDRRLLCNLWSKLQLWPGNRVVHVSVEILGQLLNAFGKGWIGSHLSQTQIRNLRQKQSRILLALLPEIGIEIAKDFRSVGGPTPPIIPGKFCEWLQRRRQFTGRHRRGFVFNIWGHLFQSAQK